MVGQTDEEVGGAVVYSTRATFDPGYQYLYSVATSTCLLARGLCENKKNIVVYVQVAGNENGRILRKSQCGWQSI